MKNAMVSRVTVGDPTAEHVAKVWELPNSWAASDTAGLTQSAAILEACIFCADETEAGHHHTANSLHVVRRLVYGVFVRARKSGVDTGRLLAVDRRLLACIESRATLRTARARMRAARQLIAAERARFRRREMAA